MTHVCINLGLTSRALPVQRLSFATRAGGSCPTLEKNLFANIVSHWMNLDRTYFILNCHLVDITVLLVIQLGSLLSRAVLWDLWVSMSAHHVPVQIRSLKPAEYIQQSFLAGKVLTGLPIFNQFVDFVIHLNGWQSCRCPDSRSPATLPRKTDTDSLFHPHHPHHFIIMIDGHHWHITFKSSPSFSSSWSGAVHA